MATSIASEQRQSLPLEATVSKTDILKELSIAQGIVERKATVPILSNLMLETHGNQLLITATDLDHSLRTSCPAQVTKQGSCTVPARKLYEYVRLLADGPITIKVLANDWVQIRSGRSNTKMVGLPRQNFPSLPLYPAQAAIHLPSAALRTLIGRTIFAISQEESRYTINGALLILQADTMTMVATDGHRLAHVQATNANVRSAEEMRVLIPRKALAEVNSLLNLAAVDTLEFSKSESNLFFHIGGRLLTSRQLAGTFPNHEAVMPKEYAGSLVLDSNEFTQAIQRVAQFSDERSNAVRFKAENNQLCLSSSGSETGESEETLETSYAGKPLSVGFNSRYLLDFMKAVDMETVSFHFKESSTAAEFRPHEAADGLYRSRYIVMPMRV